MPVETTVIETRVEDVEETVEGKKWLVSYEIKVFEDREFTVEDVTETEEAVDPKSLDYLDWVRARYGSENVSMHKVTMRGKRMWSVYAKGRRGIITRLAIERRKRVVGTRERTIKRTRREERREVKRERKPERWVRFRVTIAPITGGDSPSRMQELEGHFYGFAHEDELNDAGNAAIKLLTEWASGLGYHEAMWGEKTGARELTETEREYQPQRLVKNEDAEGQTFVLKMFDYKQSDTTRFLSKTTVNGRWWDRANTIALAPKIYSSAEETLGRGGDRRHVKSGRTKEGQTTL